MAPIFQFSSSSFVCDRTNKSKRIHRPAEAPDALNLSIGLSSTAQEVEVDVEDLLRRAEALRKEAKDILKVVAAERGYAEVTREEAKRVLGIAESEHNHAKRIREQTQSELAMAHFIKEQIQASSLDLTCQSCTKKLLLVLSAPPHHLFPFNTHHHVLGEVSHHVHTSSS